MDARTKLLLAVAICEWDSAIKHLEILVRTGADPDAAYAVTMLGSERRHLCMEWVTGNMVDISVPTIVAQARAYATEHQSEIDELTNETGAGT